MKLVTYADLSDAAGVPGCQLDCLPSKPRASDDLATNLQQCYQIQECLDSDLLACDARLSLFVAAASSYRYETLLRPFPKEFLDCNQRPDIDAIFDVVVDIDRLESVQQQLAKGKYGSQRADVISLLHAVLVRHGERVALSTLGPCVFDDLYTHLQIAPPQWKPTQIFEVTPSPKCAHTKVYTHLREQHCVQIGFYGGKLEQMYAMLTMGCLPMDEPLELTSSVDEALKRSPQRPSWGGSRCGAIVSCVAIVEYVVLAAHVTAARGTSHVTIRDASCMQISYLMFFGQSFAKYESALVRQPRLPVIWGETVKWMESNKYALSLGVYLMCLSLTSSSGRGIMHKFALTGLYMLRKGFLKI